MKTLPALSKIGSILALTSVLALGAFSTTGCSSTRTHDSTGEYVDDSVITTKVKTVLLKDDSVKSFSISVETMKGVVQLSGFVNTQTQKDLAGADASSVKGVTSVSNNLIVK